MDIPSDTRIVQGDFRGRYANRTRAGTEKNASGGFDYANLPLTHCSFEFTMRSHSTITRLHFPRPMKNSKHAS